MKGWKETYTNIVLNEEYGFKEKKLVKDLEKAIDKTGDLIKKIPDDYEDSNAYQELAQGQNALEYGIGILPGDFENYLNENKKEISELAVTFRNKRHDHGQSSAEKKGAEFNRKQEQKQIEVLLKMISKMDAIQKNKMQYNAEVYGPQSKFSEALMAAESQLLDYYYAIEDGKYDGKVEVEK